MVKLLWAFCVLAVWASGVAHSAPSPTHAPAPSVDCSNVLLNLADCLDYVQNGSTASKPKGSCCSNLKGVLKENAMCLCDAFKTSSSFGVALNMTRAMSLPSACGLSAPPLKNCGTTAVPTGAPEASPSPMSPGSPMSPATPSSISEVPAPSPSQSGAKGLTVSVSVILVSMVACKCSFF